MFDRMLNFFKAPMLARLILVVCLFTGMSCEDEFVRKANFKQYYENGALKVVGNRNEDGYMHGPYVIFFENGNVQTKMNWDQGHRTGLVINYYENGNTQFEMNWKDNYLEGNTKKYYENGVLKSEGFFTRDSEDRFFRSYYENGMPQEIRQIRYVRSANEAYLAEKHVLSKTYYEDGSQKEELRKMNVTILFEKKYEQGEFLVFNVLDIEGNIQKSRLMAEVEF